MARPHPRCRPPIVLLRIHWRVAGWLVASPATSSHHRAHPRATGIIIASLDMSSHRWNHPRVTDHILVPAASFRASSAPSWRLRPHPRFTGHILASRASTSRLRLHPLAAGDILEPSATSSRCRPHPRVLGNILGQIDQIFAFLTVPVQGTCWLQPGGEFRCSSCA